MPRLFHDPTPRIERGNSLCTVVSVGAESATHVGKAGTVAFRGRNYGATIIGTVAAGDQAHFVHTRGDSVWAIQRGTYYRSAFPKTSNEWAKKSPASLAMLELMKGNPRYKLFQPCTIKSIDEGVVTADVGALEVVVPAMIAGTAKTPSSGIIGKKGLFSRIGLDHLVFSTESIAYTKDFSLSIVSGYTQREIWWISSWPGPWPWPGGTYSYVYRWEADIEAVLSYWRSTTQANKWFYVESPTGDLKTPELTVTMTVYPDPIQYFGQSISSFTASGVARLTAYSDSDYFEWRYVP